LSIIQTAGGVIAEGQGGAWTLYMNGQAPTTAQARQIVWTTNSPVGMKDGLGPTAPLGSFKIDANGAATCPPGTYTLTATYQGVSTSTTFTRVPNPSPTPLA